VQNKPHAGLCVVAVVVAVAVVVIFSIPHCLFSEPGFRTLLACYLQSWFVSQAPHCANTASDDPHEFCERENVQDAISGNSGYLDAQLEAVIRARIGELEDKIAKVRDYLEKRLEKFDVDIDKKVHNVSPNIDQYVSQLGLGLGDRYRVLENGLQTLGNDLNSRLEELMNKLTDIDSKLQENTNMENIDDMKKNDISDINDKLDKMIEGQDKLLKKLRSFEDSITELFVEEVGVNAENIKEDTRELLRKLKVDLNESFYGYINTIDQKLEDSVGTIDKKIKDLGLGMQRKLDVIVDNQKKQESQKFGTSTENSYRAPTYSSDSNNHQTPSSGRLKLRKHEPEMVYWDHAKVENQTWDFLVWGDGWVLGVTQMDETLKAAAQCESGDKCEKPGNWIQTEFDYVFNEDTYRYKDHGRIYRIC